MSRRTSPTDQPAARRRAKGPSTAGLAGIRVSERRGLVAVRGAPVAIRGHTSEYSPQLFAATFFSTAPSPTMECLERSPWRLGSDVDLFFVTALGGAGCRGHTLA